jgi:tRNA-binding protein
MYNLVYQPHTLGDFLAIYLHFDLPVTSHKVSGPIVSIYHQETLIGFNIQQPRLHFPDLNPGILRQFSSSDYQKLIALFSQYAIPITLPTYQSGFLTASLTSKQEHPDADNLFICQLDLGGKLIQVVTNSLKVKVGDRLIVALPGAMLNDGTVVEESMMMKVKSEGMLCSEKTLGIKPETQTGVLVLPEHTEIGRDPYDR